MRLHRLTITAFGPFVETADVDFDALADAGLFLLSGATGAGKSSVLDAVCFALYGAVPGDRNHAGRLRSDQAPAGLPPEVTLEVTLAGRRFRIVRSPAWERPKKRGTGTTREQARVTLSEHAGGSWRPLSSRLDETGDLLSGLLGMSLDQFCQVALLPQGQFQAFLRADSGQRHKLLARLFRTGRFERVEAWLRDHRIELRRESEDHTQAISDLLSRISEVTATPVPDLVADVSTSSGDGTLDEWLTGLSAAADEAEASTRTDVDLAAAADGTAADRLRSGSELAAARDRVIEAARAVDRLTSRSEAHRADVERLTLARRADGLRPLVALVDERSKRLAAATDRARAARVRAAEAGLDVADLPGEASRAADSLAQVRALLPAEERLDDLREQVVAAVRTAAEVEREAELADAERVALVGRSQLLQAEVESAAEAVRALPAAQAEVTALRAARSARAEALRLAGEHALVKAEHAATVLRAQDARELWLDLRERRIAGMAAELAGALAVGDDCPVCGSAEHPRPARPGSTHPDAEAERTALRAVDDAKATEHALELRVRELEGRLATARAASGEAGQAGLDARLEAAEKTLVRTGELAGRHDPLRAELARAEARREALDHEAGACRVRLAELATTRTHLEDRVAALEEQVSRLRGDHPGLGEVLEALESRRTLAQAAVDDAALLAAAEASVTEAEVALSRAALEAGFDTAAEARTAELDAMDLAALERRVQEHLTALAMASAVIDERGSAELFAAPAPDVAALERAREQAAADLERARAVADRAERLRARLGGLMTALAEALEAWAPVRERLALATAVSSFADGKAADNRWQMRLSAYVLAHRLSQVVAAANERLAGMSDQRYSLEHVGRRGAGETRGGLSLVVRDDWSGESRDPATLSGGETFVVSLALALGLADVIAHEAGGADLATLFVDEGFGSLDAETLDDVLDILDTLRENGRAVGVVSHVAEMRDRIPTQLVVTKSRTGSAVRISG